MSRPQWNSIIESLRTSIQTDELAPGHRLPAEEEVADAWGVSRQTAHQAIREFLSEGLTSRRSRARPKFRSQWRSITNALI